jgi:hypothetical protein
MMAGLSVVPVKPPTKAEVNAAWRALNKLQLEAIEDPKKLTDREFFEALTSAEAEFKRLFNAMDRQ